MSGEGFFSSKAFIISSVILFGSGAAFLIYQQYLWSRRQKCLSAQIVQLKQQIIQLESDIKQIKDSGANSSSTDEMEEIFVDASDVAQEIDTQDELGSHNLVPEEISRTSGHLARFLAKVDQQMERGGIENLRNAQATLTEVINKVSMLPTGKPENL